MPNVVMMLVGILLALVGLLMIARAADDMFAFAGVVFTVFGVLFSFGIVRRMTQ